MANLPINPKDILDAFGDIDTARQQPVCVCVILDQSAPADQNDLCRSAFSSVEANARVTVEYLEGAQPKLPYGCDLAVVSAGFSEFTGALSEQIRQHNIPVLVVTTMPDIVIALAQTSGHPLNEQDVLSPAVGLDPAALVETTDFYREPYPLDEAREDQMREAMGLWIVEVFQEKKLAFALCFPFIRKALALDAVRATSLQNAAIGAVVLLPGADMPVMTANQAKMVLQIAAAYGQKMGLERIKELGAVVAGAFALRTAARQVVGVVPGLGWVMKGAIGYAGTLAMGKAAIAYFEATVEQNKPVAEALDAARAEAERVAAIAQQETNPASAAKAVAQNYAQNAAGKVREVADRAIPAAQELVNNVAQAAGSTPDELGKKAFDSFCEATGTTPSELGKRALKTAVSLRGKKK